MKKQLAFWSTLRSKHGDVAMHLDAQNTVLQTTEVENRVSNVYVCRLWIGRQNPDQMMNITKVWWFFPSQQASKVGELTWPCHMVPVNSTWPWTKVSRWKPPGSWNILTSPGGEFIKMDSESHDFSIFSWFTSQWPPFDFWISHGSTQISSNEPRKCRCTLDRATEIRLWPVLQSLRAPGN